MTHHYYTSISWVKLSTKKILTCTSSIVQHQQNSENNRNFSINEKDLENIMHHKLYDQEFSYLMYIY